VGGGCSINKEESWCRKGDSSRGKGEEMSSKHIKKWVTGGIIFLQAVTKLWEGFTEGRGGPSSLRGVPYPEKALRELK